MKRLLFISLLFCTTFSVFAELNGKPHRKVEIAIDGSAAFSNNYFSVSDYMVKDVVVDLQKIADEMPKYGWKLNTAVDSRIAVNLNLTDENRFSVFMGVNGSGNGNVAKELFELIGYGNELDKTYDISTEAYADAFFETGVSWRHLLDNGVAVTFTPAVYAPLVFFKTSNASVDVTTNTDGTTLVKAQADVRVYSAFPHDIFDAGGNYMSYIAGASGFDMSLAAEYPLNSRLDVGAFTHFPLIPGRTRYLSTTTAYANYTVDNVLNSIRDNEDLFSDDSGTEDWEYSSETKYINRPFRLGVQAAYRPFGQWLTFAPSLDLAVRYPFMSEVTAFMEYNLAASAVLANILGLTLSTGLQEQVFIQELGFMVNTRVFELDTAVSLQGGSFVNCFKMTGMGVKLGFRFGF